MKSLTQRELQAESRRNQLIEIALALFAERGVENVSMKDLAAEAQVAQGLIYHYFQSKEALLTAVFQEHNPFPQVRAMVEQISDLPASAGLDLFARRLAELLPEKRLVFRLLLRELLSPRSELLAQALPEREEAVALLAQVLQRRAAAGELRPHDSLLVVNMLVSSLLMLFMAGQPLEALAPQVVTTLLDGIRAVE